MDEPLFLKPARPGLLIPLPGKPGEYLPADGGVVPPDSYWRRRLKDGDAVIVKRPVKAVVKEA